MNDTLITIQGWVGTEPDERYAGEVPVIHFRVGSTPRRWNKAANGFVDLETNWYTVNAWRRLGLNALESLRKGDPVVVYGRLTTQVYTDGDGRRTQSTVIEAVSIGHDLTRGTTEFTRNPAAQPGTRDDEAVKELNAALSVDGPQISSDGELIDDLVSPMGVETPRIDTATGEILEESVA